MNSPNFELVLAALNEGSNGVILIDGDNRVVFWNRWMEKKTGLSSETVGGSSLTEIFPELTGSRIVKAVQQAIDDGLPAVISHKLNPTPFPLISEILDADSGQRMSQLVNIVALSQPDKRRHAMIQIEDITQTVLREATLRSQTRELELREEELIKSREEAFRASTTKGEFLANMSHEIRTPLNAIIGLTTLAMESRTPQQQAGYLAKIESAGNSLLSLINDILDFSKIEAGKLELESIPFALQEAVNHLYDLFSAPAREKNLAFKVEIAPGVPNYLLGDGVRLKQILINLVNNAVKFTTDGSITVQVGMFDGARVANGEVALHFQVKDTGIGLEEEQIPRLFQSFTQADGTTSRRFGGTGLGLAICKRLVEMMNGEIWVESHKDRGSNFQFSACFKLSDAAKSDHHAASALHGSRNSPGMEEELAGLRILLVEDNKINQEVAAETLRRAGMEVTIANNGRQALDLLESSSVDGILMDIQMPVMDGFAASRAIRHDLGLVDIPIIAITANALSGDRERCLESGMTDYITKPIRRQALFTCLAKWIGKKGGSQEESETVADAEVMEPVSTARILDTADGLDIMGDNMELYRSLLVMFINKNQNTAEEIIGNIRDGDREAATFATHSMKGSAANIGAVNLNEVSAALEMALVENREEAIRPLLDQFKRSLALTIKAAEEFCG